MGEINYITHLNAVFEHFSKDKRLNATHISLYVALFQLWNHNFFKQEFYINREEVMAISKIGSKSTYHRCIKELNYWKYLNYYPSHNPFKGSRIKMFEFGTSTEQAVDQDCTKNGTSTGQVVVPIIKQIQTIETNKNKVQKKNLRNSESDENKNYGKNYPSVPYRDHLKISDEKNYDEPL
ncbi:hypothetical protein D1013_09270 [Euzebyella marina]|uniref:Uncharacterized protein n=1 Tax=Euzebyella marina TaxID=1761453 RepID=A0A3G2L5N8_9FLAO|nr:hypothetical protein [Euzebyella marina]AYN67538.1 hypothetical protein D1013_09270 [Euzebyella marina]